jgi:Fe2+ transport system protein B
MTHPSSGAAAFRCHPCLWCSMTTFTLGAYPMDWIDAGRCVVQRRSCANTMPEGMLKDLLIDGIISGTGSVIIFLPNILILFFFISLHRRDWLYGAVLLLSWIRSCTVSGFTEGRLFR